MRDVVKLDDYVVIDTETTGLSRTDRILEIAAAKIVNHSIVATYTQLINPGMPIPSFITSLTGISDAMVAEAPSIETALPEFLSFCEDLPAVGHNIGFDLGMIRRSCEFAGIECTLSMGEDVMYLARRCYPEWEGFSLSFVCGSLDVQDYPVHRALKDVYATYAAYEKLINTPVSEKNYWAMRRNARRYVPDISKMAEHAKARGIDFTGMAFVITGTCPLMTREEATDLIQRLGGVVKSEVTKKCTCLIYEEGFTSSKTKKAADLREKGIPIALMTMQQFLQLISVIEAQEEPQQE